MCILVRDLRFNENQNVNHAQVSKKPGESKDHFLLIEKKAIF
jgi:hypothetical protein